MKRTNLTLFICLIALSGCATKQPTTHIYWTSKSGIVSVHRVIGKVDTIEKLSEKPLDQTEVDASNLAKGHYFKVIESHADAPVKPVEPKPKKDAKKEAVDGTKLAEMRSELHELKAQVSQLKDRVAERSTTPQAAAPADSPGIAQEVQPDQETPRLSQ